MQESSQAIDPMHTTRTIEEDIDEAQVLRKAGVPGVSSDELLVTWML